MIKQIKLSFGPLTLSATWGNDDLTSTNKKAEHKHGFRGYGNELIGKA